jgi:hypothetical protein
MVARIMIFVALVVLAVAALAVNGAQAAYCAPGSGACPIQVPIPGPGMASAGPAYPMGPPAMAPPRPLPGMQACPLPCPPPACDPCAKPGFNPFSAVAGIVALPFKLIGSLFCGNKSCDAPPCAPACCMPMLPPPCPAVCAPPAAKCKPQRMPRAAYRSGPMMQ